jgi:hypothetical protein
MSAGGNEQMITDWLAMLGNREKNNGIMGHL